MTGVIGILDRPLGYAEFWKSVIMMKKPAGTGFMFVSGSRVDYQRNQIIEKVLETDAQWLLFLDDDHMIPADALQRLLSLNLPVVGAFYITRTEPYRSAALINDPAFGGYRTMTLEETVPQGPVETAVLGMGCTLIRRDVLEKIGTTPFQYTWRDKADGTREKIGEDLTFSEAVYKAGFKMYTDTHLVLPHIAPRGMALVGGEVKALTETS